MRNFKGEEKEVLIWDSYKCHYQGDEILKTIEDLKLLKVIIPGGCTRAVQTRDVV